MFIFQRKQVLLNYHFIACRTYVCLRTLLREKVTVKIDETQAEKFNITKTSIKVKI